MPLEAELFEFHSQPETKWKIYPKVEELKVRIEREMYEMPERQFLRKFPGSLHGESVYFLGSLLEVHISYEISE